MTYSEKTAVFAKHSLDTAASFQTLSEAKEKHRSVRQWMGDKLWVREFAGYDSKLYRRSHSEGSTVAKRPTRSGHAAIAKLLLAMPGGMDIQKSRKDGKSLLILAVETGDAQTVELLLDGVSESEKERGLTLAVFAGNLEIVRVFLDGGTNVDTWIEACGSVLEVAAYSKHESVVSLLLERKANPNPKRPSPHGSPLQAASFEGNMGIVTRLKESGAKVNAEGGFHGSALQAACYRGHEKVVRYLLANGATVNMEGGEHGCPLAAATASGQSEIMKILQENGATTPAVIRQSSKIDRSTEETMRRIGREVRAHWGAGAVERRVEKILQEFRATIAKKEEDSRTLEVLMEIGFRAFKVAITIGRESLLEFLTKNAMMFLVTAVSEGYEDGTKQMAQVWAKALSWAVDQNKIQLVRRMLTWCISDFKVCIESGEDDHAEAIIKTGIEVQLAIMSLDPQNVELRDLMIELWVGAFEDMMESRFSERTEDIIRGYADKFQLSQNTVEWDTMRILATTGMLSLQRALLFRKNRVINTLSRVFQEVLQRIFENEMLAVKLLIAGLEWEGSSELTELVLDIGTTLMKTIAPSIDGAVTGEQQEAISNRIMLMNIVASTVRSVLNIASTANRLDHVEFLINYVARKQIRQGRLMDREGASEGHNYGVDTTPEERIASIEAVFTTSRSKGKRRSVIDDSLDRIIADLHRDRSSLPSGVKERKKYTKKREMFWHKNWQVYLWCFGRV